MFKQLKWGNERFY